MILNERDKLIYLHGYVDCQKILGKYCETWMKLKQSQDIKIVDVVGHVQKEFEDIKEKEINI